MSTVKEGTALDADKIIELIAGLQPEARKLFQNVLSDVLERGGDLSETMVNELAKKYADKARKLVGSGGD